jgi:hypothetical protein
VSIQERLIRIANFLRLASGREYRDSSKKKSLLQNLEGVGASLFEALLPPVLQEMIQTWTDDAWLSISSNEQWIPWELLHDGQGFLGQRFMLFRLPRQTSRRAERQGIQRKSELTPPQKIVHVIGGDLRPEYSSVCSQFFQDVSANLEVKPLYGTTLVDLMEAIQDADVVHLTCHGHLNPLRIQITRDDDPLICLTIDSLKTSKFKVQNGCLVFANTCSSAAAESQFGEFVSFGWEFYLKGAAVFIGTLGTIPTENALTFAAVFYKALICDTGGDICRAYQIAKRKTNGDSLIPLLYCFYGNPRSIPNLPLGDPRRESCP